jgi:hypothetical protein
MGDVVNLRMSRKRASRLRDEASAAENRAVYGRSKGDRRQATEERGRTAKHLNQHRIETGDDR